MKAIAALLFVAAAQAAADDDPIAILTRARDKIMAHAQNIPNHTCIESIVRDWYDYTPTTPPRSCDALLGRRKRAGVGALTQLSTTDRLRLDVALADSREVYSWPGANQFDDRDLNEFVPPGAIGTGAFGAALLDLFAIPDPRFIYEGMRPLNGRTLMDYSFQVSPEQSHYKAAAGTQWIMTGYTGSLLIDPVTADLVRLTVRTEELPASTRACEVTRTLDYSMARLGNIDYLLPTVTRERYIATSGAEAENTIAFAACREFRGQSSLTFDQQPSIENPPLGQGSAVAVPFQLPAGLPVTIELTSTVRADQAAAGDLIEGRLAAPLWDAAKKQILIPQGASLSGRLMRVQVRYATLNRTTISLRWETGEVNGVKAALSLIPAFQTLTHRTAQPAAPQTRAPQAWVFDLPKPGEERYGTFELSGENVVMGKGQTRWLTVKP